MSLLHRWREEAAKAGRTITRIAVAFEAGRNGFWLARKLLIALWRLVTTGEVPQGVVLRPAA